ncbi:MAG: ACT domain-containing protein [Lachnospiraceae bacterium]|nr:ACT domain-containing protein [Lachnospiraceae bacterium]
MAITQLSAFLENSSGALCEAVSALTDAGVNIRALSVAETKDFGILRLIVSDREKTREALDDEIIIRETPVIAVNMNDQSGALKGILEILKEAQINIEYIYAFTGAVQGSAYVVMRVDDINEAESVLSENGIKTLTDEDMDNFLV